MSAPSVFFPYTTIRQWLLGGLGPGALDTWDPLMKGIGILTGTPFLNPKAPGPKPPN